MTPGMDMDEKTRIEAFVGKNADFYLKKWRIAENGTTPGPTANKAAFLTGAFWLLYRKLYVPLLLVVIVLVADVSIENILAQKALVNADVINAWDRLSPFVYASVIGMFGNTWYWRKYLKTVERASLQSPDPAMQEAYLRAKGGPNALAVWVAAGLLAVLITAVLVYA